MKFNPLRLTIARKRRLLNKKQLADSIGVKLHSIIRWEKNQSEPTLENLQAIVRILGFPQTFFFGPEIPEPTAEIVSFRSQTTMTAALRDAALAAGAVGFLLSDWIEHRFELPQNKLMDLRAYEPEPAAQALRQEWGLGERPVSNMIHLLESKGVRVYSLAENTAKVNAYSLWRLEKPYVFLNTFKSAECSRFDAAHELGHLVLHQDGKTDREAEDQANKFASAFLMPRGDVVATIPRVQFLQQLIKLKSRWRVSLAALNYRLHALNITNEWKNRDYCIEIAKRGYNREEPAPIEREKSIIWEKILKELWADKITHNDIAAELCLPVGEISDLIFGLLSPGPLEQKLERRPLAILPDLE